MKTMRLVVCTIVAAAAMMIAVHESRAQCCGYASLPLGLLCTEALSSGTSMLVLDSSGLAYIGSVADGQISLQITNTVSGPVCGATLKVQVLQVHATEHFLGDWRFDLDPTRTPTAGAIDAIQPGSAYPALIAIHAFVRVTCSARPGVLYRSIQELTLICSSAQAFCPVCPVVTFASTAPVQFENVNAPGTVVFTLQTLEVTTI